MLRALHVRRNFISPLVLCRPCWVPVRGQTPRCICAFVLGVFVSRALSGLLSHMFRRWGGRIAPWVFVKSHLALATVSAPVCDLPMCVISFWVDGVAAHGVGMHFPEAGRERARSCSHLFAGPETSHRRRHHTVSVACLVCLHVFCAGTRGGAWRGGMEEHGYSVIRVLGQGGSCQSRVYEACSAPPGAGANCQSGVREASSEPAAGCLM